MKFVLALLLVSTSAFASPKPCLTQARKSVSDFVKVVYEDSDCDIKLRKVHQSDVQITYRADISCVGEGGFFDMWQDVVMKYEILPSGKYSCKKL